MVLSKKGCLGIDLSLTGTGLAFATSDLEVASWLIRTSGSKDDTFEMSLVRINDIRQRVLHVVSRTRGALRGKSYMAVLEGASYGSYGGKNHERAGLWWMVYRDLHELHIPIAVVSPGGRAKYATGNGRAGKEEVLTSAAHRYHGTKIVNNNVADAVVLAAMGARMLHFPLEESSLGPQFLSALEGCSWPEFV